MKYIYSNDEVFSNDLDINDMCRMIELNKSCFPLPEMDAFFDNWKKALCQQYTAEINKTRSLIGRRIFRESLFISENAGTNEMRFHFDIDRAISLSRSKESQAIDLKHISDHFSNPLLHTIKFTQPHTTDNPYDYCQCEAPVILVIFCHKGFDYLVIDGNHRIDARKRNAIDTINAILLTPEETISILQSNFEIAAYLFLYEGYLLSKGDFSIIPYSNSRLYY